jgi:Na+/citrate or Na+/malate symporter
VGILNAAVWFGSAIFFTFGTGLVPFSQEMRNLLGPNNFPYFSGAIAQILIARYFAFQVGCAIIAVLHLFAEWLWLQPRLKTLHATKYGVSNRPEIRETAARSFKTWHGVSQVVNLLMVGGLAVYLWRAANPSDETRFVSAVKFTMR